MTDKSVLRSKWYLVEQPWLNNPAIYTKPDPNGGICITDGKSLDHFINWCDGEIEEEISEILEHIVKFTMNGSNNIKKISLKDKVVMTFESV